MLSADTGSLAGNTALNHGELLPCRRARDREKDEKYDACREAGNASRQVAWKQHHQL